MGKAMIIGKLFVKCKRKTLSATFAPRRSHRIAKLSPQATASTVCQQLGFRNPTNDSSSSALEHYARVFDQPLRREHVMALAALFGFQAPPEGQVVTSWGSTQVWSHTWP
jgi:hypothetical protein